MRNLTPKQHKALDRLDEGLGLRVVGWVDDRHLGRGPIIAAPDGNRQLLNFTGRLRGL